MDYTLYNKIKEKFPPQPGKVILVSLKPENQENLEGIAFTIDEIDALHELAHTHVIEALPYALIGGFFDDDLGYEYFSREFTQTEDFVTGQIIESSLGKYHNDPVDIEALRSDFKKLLSGVWLEGNA